MVQICAWTAFQFLMTTSGHMRQLLINFNDRRTLWAQRMSPVFIEYINFNNLY